MPRPKRVNDPALQLFFDERASQVSSSPDLVELCFVSGKEPRIWAQTALYDDLVRSIRDQLDLRPEHHLLEVGCAAGFLARGLAPLCRRYTGIDLAPQAVAKAAGLGLANADFRAADGTALPFADGTFDRVLCYDVFTNFGRMDVVARVVHEMLRVTRPQGRAMVGSLPDAARQAEYVPHANAVSAALERQFGAAPVPVQRRPPLGVRLAHWWRKAVRRVQPQIVCYYFRRADFEAIGARARAATRIEEVHRLNPYFGYRFNAIYSKGAA